MKKQKLSVLVIVTLIFIAFTFGFFWGRNENREGIQVSVPASMLTEPTLQPELPEVTEETTPSIVFPIDINTATKEQLQSLPGIGDVLAGRIISYREEKGHFNAPEELMYVEGIGEKRIEDIIELITIGG